MLQSDWLHLWSVASLIALSSLTIPCYSSPQNFTAKIPRWIELVSQSLASSLYVYLSSFSSTFHKFKLGNCKFSVFLEEDPVFVNKD